MFQGRLLSLSNPSSGRVAPCSNRRLAGSLLLSRPVRRQGLSATYGREVRVVGRSNTVGAEAVLSAHTTCASRLPPGRPVPSSSCVTPACLILRIGFCIQQTQRGCPDSASHRISEVEYLIWPGGSGLPVKPRQGVVRAREESECRI